MCGSIISAVGISSLMKAVSLGPMGPVFAIGDAYPPLLVVIEALRNSRMISGMEFIALLMGMYGVFIMAIPNYFNKYCFPCCKIHDDDD